MGYTECLPDGSGVDLDETALLLHEYESMEQVARELAGQVTRWEISTLEGRVLPLDEWPAYRALRGDFVRNLTLHYRSLVTGREWDCELNSAPILDDDGTVVRIVHTVRDVTEREATERERRDLELELRRLASTDPLTGVANRRAFLDRAQSEVNRAIRSGRALTLAILDVDELKTFNDTCGHVAGDAALIAMTTAVSSIVRDFDAFGRLGGDEFGLVLVEATEHDARAIVERIRAAVSELDDLADCPLTLTVSVGLGVLAEGRDTARDLFLEADRGLYRAKARGRNRVERGDAPGSGVDAIPVE